MFINGKGDNNMQVMRTRESITRNGKRHTWTTKALLIGNNLFDFSYFTTQGDPNTRGWIQDIRIN